MSNPQNPDQTDLPDSSGAARHNQAPADSTPGAQYDEAPDLESQVDDLLAEVTETVDEISRKLGHGEPEPPAPAPDYTDTAVLEDELAALADDPELDTLDAQIIEPDEIAPAPAATTGSTPTAVSDDPIAGSASDAEQAAPEPTVALHVPDTGSKAQEQQEAHATPPAEEHTTAPDPEPAPENTPPPDALSEPTPDPEPDAATDAGPAAETAETAKTDEPAATTNNTDTAALEDELAALADDAHVDNLDATFTDHDAATTEDKPAEPEASGDEGGADAPEAVASTTAETDEPTDSDHGQPETESEAIEKTASPDYTDTGALEDELAALAADSDVDGLDADFTNHEPEATAAQGTEQPAGAEAGDSNALDDELASLAAETLDDDLEGTVAAVALENPAQTRPASDAAQSPAQPAANASAGPPPEPVGSTEGRAQSAPATTPTGPPKWGWLPTKPEWPETYSKARPLVIAWRHAAWIIPPLVAHLASLAWARTKTAAIKAEPHARHAVAVAATPLSSREERTRSVIGWFAIYTFFVATCLWIYVLIGRSPVVPEPTATPTILNGQTNTTTADAET